MLDPLAEDLDLVIVRLKSSAVEQKVKVSDSDCDVRSQWMCEYDMYNGLRKANKCTTSGDGWGGQ